MFQSYDRSKEVVQKPSETVRSHLKPAYEESVVVVVETSGHSKLFLEIGIFQASVSKRFNNLTSELRKCTDNCFFSKETRTLLKSIKGVL